MRKNQQLKLLVLTLTTVLLLAVNVYAQNMRNVAFGGYGGITSTLLNPALMSGSKVFLDINLLSTNAFIQNNMYYFPAGYKTIWNLIATPGYLIHEGGEFKFDRTYNFYSNKNDKYLAVNEFILGPSVMFQNSRHSFGITSALRSSHTVNNVPFQVPIVIYQGTFDDFHYVNFDDYNYNFVSMSWGEIGLSYAYDFYKSYNNKLTIGASAKLLLGYEGAYIAIENANYIFIGYNTLDVLNLNSEIAYSLPIGYEDFEENTIVDFGSNPIIKGIGQGIDIGLVYTKTEAPASSLDRRRVCAQPYQPYKYRIGFSIMDIGGISFKKNAAVHSFDNQDAYWQNFDEIDFDGVNTFMRTMSYEFYGDSTASYSGDKFRIGLPTKISLQFDYKINENFFVASLWNQPVQVNLHSLYSTPLISVIPRFEKRYVGVSLPVSLYNYRQPAIGLALRIYSLTVGTEMLNSWIGLGDLTGMDVYFSIKLNLEKGRCLNDDKGACYNADFGRKKHRVKQ